MLYLVNHLPEVGQLLLQHLTMTGLTLAIAITIALPLTLVIYQIPWLRIPILGILGIIYTIPSLALIILLVPLLGLNATTVIAAMVLYIQGILVRNILTGLESIDPTILDAAEAMGMNGWQRWWWVQLPLALPLCVAGVRLGAVVTLAIATLGAKFNGGGLGRLLFDGIQTNRYDKIWAGSIAVALVAWAINGALLGLEQRLKAQS
ncbi:ABC transporter permease [Prochlorothrix hollandica]|uniref:ABC transporter permease n=1 Tax=Prochlorothrix hollandica PCC 9006 = CALU 1027 TaxID=317619 RepID=A0A0M2Q3T4_PROHO|nr:ABC transporter permease [Prochlorothrix hollandica]KKJ01257.1 ABC transporter permease [Prochlorothrix hollandica PCC 9006 = CALU 1027]